MRLHLPPGGAWVPSVPTFLRSPDLDGMNRPTAVVTPSHLHTQRSQLQIIFMCPGDRCPWEGSRVHLETGVPSDPQRRVARWAPGDLLAEAGTSEVTWLSPSGPWPQLTAFSKGALP